MWFVFALVNLPIVAMSEMLVKRSDFLRPSTMRLCASLALAVAALLTIPASANPTEPRADDAALSFIDDLVANLTEAADKAQSCAQEVSRTVDLGYAKYEGYHDEDMDINIWKG